MLDIDDLRLIKDQIVKVKRSTYFDRALAEHSDALVDLVNYIEANEASIDVGIINLIKRILFNEQMFLRGSVSGEVPYEVVLSLKLALSDWGHSNDIITTALLDENQYYFRFSQSIWNVAAVTLPGFVLPTNQFSLIQIAFPRLYRSMPLMAVPLYHELGHFIDLKNRVSEVAVILATRHGPPVSGMNLAHLQEHFADLFAASYCGSSFTGVLEFIAAGHPSSATHPATADRVQVIGDFLSATANPIVELFQQALTLRGLPNFQARFSLPDAPRFLDNIRPVALANAAEVHGIYPAAFDYLQKIRAHPVPGWVSQTPRDVVRIVNDLVEKSIRNFDIVDRWNNGNP